MNRNKPRPPTLYKSKNGDYYWRCQWRDDSGKRRTKTFGNSNKVSESAAMRAYQAWLCTWLTSPETRNPQRQVIVRKAAQQYKAYADERYSATDRRNSEAYKVKKVLDQFEELFGSLPVDDIRPAHVDTFLQCMVDNDLARSTINGRMNVLRRWSRWCVSKMIMPPAAREFFWSVDNLKYGERGVREADKITAVDEAIVSATLDHLPATLQAVVKLQLYTSARPGELLIMRPMDIDTSKTPWLYVPGSDKPHGKHKNAWRGHDRKIYLGPKCRDIVQPFLNRVLTGFMFTPAEAVEQRRGHGYANANPSYTTDTYGQAIVYACDAAKVPRWCPLQLKHTALTRIERMENAQAARAMAGHKHVETTLDYYVEKNESAAREIAEKAG